MLFHTNVHLMLRKKPSSLQSLLVIFAIVYAIYVLKLFTPATPSSNVCSANASLLDFFSLTNEGHIKLEPSIATIVIDVGQSKTPLLPTDSTQFVIGFEPIVHTWATYLTNISLSNLLSIPVAIGDCDGMVMFNKLNFHDASSILPINADVAKQRLAKFAAQGENFSPSIFNVAHKFLVPIFRLELLLQRIPPHISIEHLKVDAQGYDFKVCTTPYNPATAFPYQSGTERVWKPDKTY